LILCFAGMATMFAGGMSMPILPLYAAELTTSLLMIGLVVSGYFIVRLFFELPIGLASDVVGRRKPMVAGVAVATLGALVCTVASDIIQLILGRALWGLGTAAFYCIATALLADLFPRERRGRMVGVFQATEFLGSVLGASFGGYVASVMGYRGLFLVCTVISFVSLVATVFIPAMGLRAVTGDWRAMLRLSSPNFRYLVNPTVVLVSIMTLTVTLRESGPVSTIVPLYAKFTLGMSVAEIGIIMAARSVGQSVGTVSGGWMADKVGKHQALILTFVLGALSMYLYTVTSLLSAWIGLMVLTGVSFGAVYCVVPTMIVEAVPESARGLAIGAYRTFLDLGGLIGPIMASLIAGLFDYEAVFYAGVILMLLGTLVTIASSRYRSKVS
jgi:MFS family permease